MEKEFIPYEQASALKELGFDASCFGFYCEEESRIEPHYPCDGRNSAPLYQQAFGWFREKYFWTIKINQISKETWSYTLINFFKDADYFGKVYSSYEEAELECLKKLIEIAQKE